MKFALPKVSEEIVYPDSDGKPMADNTLQYEWIVTTKGNTDAIYRERNDVFVAGDLLWYPVQGHPNICAAPDVLVAFGRPKGYRGSYKQWEEGGIAPQVVFEILSPNNTAGEMTNKGLFYERHGVEEYYLIKPEPPVELSVWLRSEATGRLEPELVMPVWTSPRLGVRFEKAGSELLMFRPDGQRFLSFDELEAERSQAEVRARQAEEKAQMAEEQARRTEEKARLAEEQAQKAETRAAKLAARLQALGIDPETLNGAEAEN